MALHASFFVLLILIFIHVNMHLKTAFADYGGWQGGHATFYGGGDASGTMGQCNFYLYLSSNKTTTCKKH